jgi:inorganic triphosphatase YgiF
VEHLETESKYEAGTAFVMPDLSALGPLSGPELRLLEATYYDTPGLALYRNKVTLRRRTGGPDEGWHLKLPVSAGTRRELQEPLADTIPDELATVVEHLTAGAKLQPIAMLSTERTVLLVTTPSGAPRAEVADDKVTARRLPDGEPVSWREIEVETDDSDLLAAAGKVLAAAGARPSDRASKLARLLGLCPCRAAIQRLLRAFADRLLGLVGNDESGHINHRTDTEAGGGCAPRDAPRSGRDDEWACRRWRT